MPRYDEAAMRERVLERVAQEHRLIKKLNDNGENVITTDEPVVDITSYPQVGLTERGKAIADWCMAATIHGPDGKIFADKIRLLGDRRNAELFAGLVDKQLDAQPSEHDLGIWLANPRGAAGGMFKLYALGPYVAADLMTALRDLGHA